MTIKYIKVKIAMPHCGECGEMLKGNGFEITPYECSCGVWKYDYWLKEFITGNLGTTADGDFYKKKKGGVQNKKYKLVEIS